MFYSEQLLVHIEKLQIKKNHFFTILYAFSQKYQLLQKIKFLQFWRNSPLFLLLMNGGSIHVRRGGVRVGWTPLFWNFADLPLQDFRTPPIWNFQRTYLKKDGPKAHHIYGTYLTPKQTLLRRYLTSANSKFSPAAATCLSFPSPLGCLCVIQVNINALVKVII